MFYDLANAWDLETYTEYQAHDVRTEHEFGLRYRANPTGKAEPIYDHAEALWCPNQPPSLIISLRHAFRLNVCLGILFEKGKRGPTMTTFRTMELSF